jgi:large subunit ribosomal protein L22
MIEKISVTSKYLRVSSSKIKKIANNIKGKKYKEALLFLSKLPQKTACQAWKTLKALGANANHNYSLPKENLFISDIFANKGPILKRVHARARGKAYRIEKKFSHLTISVKLK